MGVIHFLALSQLKIYVLLTWIIRPNSCGINYFPLFLLKLRKGYGISEFSACRLQLLVVVFFLSLKIDEEVKMY